MRALRLTGMTRGARKRAARVSARGLGEAVDTPQMRRFVLRLWHIENGARARRKIGPHEPGPRRLYRTCAGQEEYEAARGEFGLKKEGP